MSQGTSSKVIDNEAKQLSDTSNLRIYDMLNKRQGQNDIKINQEE